MSIKDLFLNDNLTKTSNEQSDNEIKNNENYDKEISEENESEIIIESSEDAAEDKINETNSDTKTSDNDETLDDESGVSEEEVVEEEVEKTSQVVFDSNTLEILKEGINKAAEYIASISKNEEEISKVKNEITHYKKAQKIVETLIDYGHISEEEKQEKMAFLLKSNDKDLPDLGELKKIGKLMEPIGDFDSLSNNSSSATDEFINEILS